MTSFECVSGMRLPSSSTRELLPSSISSSTRTFTRWCTLAVRPGARHLEHERGGFAAPRTARESVHRAFGDADQHLPREPRRRIVDALTCLVAGNGPDCVGDAAQLATDLPADHAAGERAADVTTRFELPGGEDGVLDPLRLHCILHELDHLCFGHAPNRIARACAAEAAPARLLGTTQEDFVAFPRDEIEATIERYVGVRADIDAGRGTWAISRSSSPTTRCSSIPRGAGCKASRR